MSLGDWGSDAFTMEPLYRDSYIPRPTMASARRVSAPPRPPRPEFSQWAKQAAEEDVIEIDDDMAHYDGTVAIHVSTYGFSDADPVFGRVSPVSPLSEEAVSSSDSHSSGVSPSNSVKKTGYLDEPRSSIRRAFSFESMQSGYSQATHMKPEQLQFPYRPGQIYEEYAEIAMSNPYQDDYFPPEPTHYSADLPSPGFPAAMEPSRRSSQTRNSGASTPNVPMSRFNSQRAPVPMQDPYLAQQRLDAAWEEVKKAVAPKLKVSIPDAYNLPTGSNDSLPPSTTHDLPPIPPPPPVPLRNPRRADAPVFPAHSEPAYPEPGPPASAKHLIHSSSSPNMIKNYHRHNPTSPPPMPAAYYQVPAPIPAPNLPVNAPAPLPTPATSDCSSEGQSVVSPISVSSSARRLNSRFSSSAHISAISPLTQTSFGTNVAQWNPPAEYTMVSPVSSASRGFHGPPPVAPPIEPAPRKYSNTMSPPSTHLRGWSDSRVGVTTEIWAGPAPAISYKDVQAKLARTNTLRSIAPGESAARTSYQPPVQTDSNRVYRESVIAGTNGNHVVHGSQRTTDEFEPIKIIPAPERKRGAPGDNMPRFSNNFAGFCKGAWRLQTAQANKAFSLRTTHRKALLPNSTTTHTKTTTLRCGKCSFEGPLARHPATLAGAADFGVNIDYSACAEKTPRTAHGVVYRWSFLFKSHVPCRTTLRKDEIVDVEDEVYGCLFCCSEGKGTVCFKGAKTLCGHIAKEHAEGIDLDKELKQRLGIVVARQPGKNEDWDIILPGRVWF